MSDDTPPDWPSRRYDVILADPPWTFSPWGDHPDARLPQSGHAEGGARHYEVMSLDALKRLPVADIAEKDCALFLWGTWPTVEQAMAVGEAWGFRFKTLAFLWAKLTKTETRWHMGLGYWTRANPEPCWLFTRGKPKRIAKDVRQLVVAPIREHSRKPDAVPRRIERLMGDTSRVELFARESRAGWDAWGNETGKFDGDGQDAFGTSGGAGEPEMGGPETRGE
jgi:N6-adenosine-specific RNA methylase IME4